MKKSVFIMALILGAVLVFSGCSKQEAGNVTSESTSDGQEAKKGSAIKKETPAEETSDNDKNNTTEATEKEEVKTPSKDETNDVSEEKAPSPQKEEAKTGTPSKSLDSIRSEIKSKVGASDAMDLDANAICSLYGIDAAGVKDAAGFVVMAGTFPHEVVMVEAKDANAAAEIEAMLRVKHDSFVEQSKGYDAENYALAQKCKVERRGNHISMFLSPDYETMTSVYGKYIN